MLRTEKTYSVTMVTEQHINSDECEASTARRGLLTLDRQIKGFGWNNVGATSQTVAQHYFTIGPMYRVIWVVAPWD